MTLAHAQSGTSQANPAACWIRGRRISWRAAEFAGFDRGPTRGGTIKLCYSRPSARGRKVMGGLVPFDQPWRLGANEATSISVPFPAQIAGVRVEPGTYTLYAIPGAAQWQLVVNRGIRRWGVPSTRKCARGMSGRHGSHRVARHARRDPHAQVRTGYGNTTELVVEWEKTRVRIPIRRASD